MALTGKGRDDECLEKLIFHKPLSRALLAPLPVGHSPACVRPHRMRATLSGFHGGAREPLFCLTRPGIIFPEGLLGTRK